MRHDNMPAHQMSGARATASRKKTKAGYVGEYGNQGNRTSRIPGHAIGEEELAFIKACEAWKEQTGVRYLSHVDHLTIAKRMGYVKV